MKLIEEGTTKSQRKLWSLVTLALFVVYSLAILFKHWPKDIPAHIAYIMGAVVTYYFVKSTVKEAQTLFGKSDVEGKGESGDKSMGNSEEMNSEDHKE